MTKPNNNSGKPQEISTETMTVKERRAALKKLGRFAAVTAPTVTLLLAAQVKPAQAQGISGNRSSRQFKNQEGPVDNEALLSAALVASAAGLDVIDGIGTCLGAIKALYSRIDRLEAAL
jgi:hypothetical protein